MRIGVTAVEGAVLAFAATLIMASSADAASVRSGSYGFEFVAAPGERNQVAAHLVLPAARSQKYTWTIRDAGAPLTSGRGCVALDEHTASCSADSESLDVKLGDFEDEFDLGHSASGAPIDPQFWLEISVVGQDGNDRISGTGGRLADFNGGRGDDVLQATADPAFFYGYGGPGNDRLIGGPSSDSLEGGGGTDQLEGGAGDDWLEDDDGEGAKNPDNRPGPDVFDGGEGSDMVSYVDRKAPMRVDLARGKSSDGDRLIGIETSSAGRATTSSPATRAPTSSGIGEDETGSSAAAVTTCSTLRNTAGNMSLTSAQTR